MKKANFYRIITICWLSFLIVSCASKAETESIKIIDPAVINETITKSDELFKQREDIAKLREAVKTLASVRNPDQRNFEVEWKFAKFNYFLGRQTDKENEAEKAFEDGEQAGKIASRIAPDKPDGYFWYAANLGEKAKKSPVTVGVKSVDDIKEAMTKVIEIDPKYQGASAYDALGQIELSTAGILGGKAEKAVEYLEKGVELNSENTYLRLHLAEAYLATGKKAEAKKQLDALLQLKPNPEYIVEYKETTEKAKKLLETRF
jgi:tetratricopeptide (TPR) repeat protein